MLSNHRGFDTTDIDGARRTLNTEFLNMPSSISALHYVDRDNNTIIASTYRDPLWAGE